MVAIGGNPAGAAFFVGFDINPIHAVGTLPVETLHATSLQVMSLHRLTLRFIQTGLVDKLFASSQIKRPLILTLRQVLG